MLEGERQAPAPLPETPSRGLLTGSMRPRALALALPQTYLVHPADSKTPIHTNGVCKSLQPPSPLSKHQEQPHILSVSKRSPEKVGKRLKLIQEVRGPQTEHSLRQRMELC